MKYNYVFFASKANYYKYMYQEMVTQSNVQIFWDKADLLPLLSPVEQKLSKIHLLEHTNALFQLPLKKIWYFRAVKRIMFSNPNPICFIWHHHYISEIQNGMIEYLRKRFPNSKHIYFFTEPQEVNNETVRYYQEKMDIVSIFDPHMAEKYNMLFIPNVYPNKRFKAVTSYKYDICFIGNDKGRREELLKISQLCKEKAIRAAFYVRKDVNCDSDIDSEQGVNYIHGKLTYAEILEITEQSRCILEMRVAPHYACSLRVQEAVIFNKKLVTNNRNIYDMPCCKDSKWISYFETPETIDWDFVLREENVNYDYNLEYSTKTWLNTIESNL